MIGGAEDDEWHDPDGAVWCRVTAYAHAQTHKAHYAALDRAEAAERALSALREPSAEVLEAAGQAYVDERRRVQRLPYAHVNVLGLTAIESALRVAVDAVTAPSQTAGVAIVEGTSTQGADT